MKARQTKALGVAVLGALVQAGCWFCTPIPQRTWNFESGCANDTCGFSVVAGTAVRAATFHEGEHGLQLSANTEIQETFEVNPSTVAASTTSSSTLIRVVVRCDALTTLRVREVVSQTRADGTLAPPSLSVQESVLEPSSAWTEQSLVLSPWAFVRNAPAVVSFTLSTSGNGSCVVDNIEYTHGPAFCPR